MQDRDELDELLSGQYDNLPEDSVEAFVVFENRVRKKYSIGEADFDGEQALKYAYEIESFAKEFQIEHEFVGKYEAQAPVRKLADHASFLQYLTSVELLISRSKINLARKRGAGVTDIVELDKGAKLEIRDLVNRVKSLLDEMNIDVRKKDILRTKLNIFLDELDRTQTRLTAFLSSMIQISSASGEAADKLKPVADLFERMWKVIGKGTKEQEKLPKWEEPKQLPSPESYNGSENESAGTSEVAMRIGEE
jgi:hypothetical protein